MSADPPVPAPPVPVLTAPWSLRPAAAEGADLDRVHAWMNRPHVAQRWDQAWPRDRWARCLAEQIAGDHSRPCMVAHDGRAVAYVEVYRVVRDRLADHYDHDPHDLGLHVAVGESDWVGRGRGTELLRVLAVALFDADPDCRRVVLEPDVTNEPMHRALEKAGYTLAERVDLGHKVATLSVITRDGALAVRAAED